MSQIVLTCPIDDLPLEARDATEVAGVPTRLQRANVPHVHLQLACDATCSNGHRWTLSGDLVLQRMR